MTLDATTAPAAQACILDARRRMNLPHALAAAAGLTAGTVVVLPAPEPGQLIVATPRAALDHLRRVVAAAITAHGAHASLADALATLSGRQPAAAPTNVPAALPVDGPILCDVAPLVALLDGDPAADALLPLLPRLQLVDAVAEDLFAAMLSAGLSMDDGDPCGYRLVMDVLGALGVHSTRADRAEWTPARIAEFALTKVGVTSPSERATLALAAHRGVPALLGRPVGQPGVPSVAVDYRDLATPTTTAAVPA